MREVMDTQAKIIIIMIIITVVQESREQNRCKVAVTETTTSCDIILERVQRVLQWESRLENM